MIDRKQEVRSSLKGVAPSMQPTKCSDFFSSKHSNASNSDVSSDRLTQYAKTVKPLVFLYFLLNNTYCQQSIIFLFKPIHSKLLRLEVKQEPGS